MFRILYNPSLGSVERAWLKLLVILLFGSVFFWTCGVCVHTHHRSRKTRCQTPTTHTKVSQVISVKHVQHSLRMDH